MHAKYNFIFLSLQNNRGQPTAHPLSLFILFLHFGFHTTNLALHRRMCFKTMENEAVSRERLTSKKTTTTFFSKQNDAAFMNEKRIFLCSVKIYSLFLPFAFVDDKMFFSWNKHENQPIERKKLSC